MEGMKAKRVNVTLSDEDVEYYESVNPGCTVLRDYVIEISYKGISITYVIFNGPYTVISMVRDCGKCYRLSWAGKLYNIDKKTFEITPVPEHFL